VTINKICNGIIVPSDVTQYKIFNWIKDYINPDLQIEDVFPGQE
jgi:hypothetical protein